VPAETVPAETMPAETVSANGSADASANGAAVSPGALNRLQEELGVQDPDDIIAMVNSLTRQLEDLYSARERLAEANITDEESVVAMVNNMQHQLESLYETQERMSQKGVKNVDNALSMIENMDAQLEALYEERESASPADLNAMRERLDQTMSELEALKEEKRRVVRERDALRRATLSPDASAPDAPDIEAPPAKDDGERREPSVPPPSTASRLETLEQNFGSRDPEQIAELIHSMEEQLGDRPAAEMKKAASQILDSFRAVVGEDVLAHLEEMSVQELDELEVGVLRLDDAGRIEQANEAALQFPGCTAEVPEALEGVNFFFDLAPSANNALFRGRFVKGVHNGSLDANFPYTFIRPEAPPVNLVVKLHRKPTEESNWILFSRL
jgi:photoactive yellow protein